MDQGLNQEHEISLNGQQPAGAKVSDGPESVDGPANIGVAPIWKGLRGLLIAQIFGQFNDQAWKQIVILLAMAAVASEAAEARTNRHRHHDALARPSDLDLAAGRGCWPTG